MWASKRFLEQCFELYKAGFVFQIEEGKRLARGFADVGYEEFCLLPGRKLLSLLSGKVTKLEVAEERFFFVVPSADEIVNEIEKLGGDILKIETDDHRSWKVDFRSGDCNTRTVDGRSIESALITALLQISQLKNSKTSLKVVNV